MSKIVTLVFTFLALTSLLKIHAQSDGKSVVIGAMVKKPNAILVINPADGNQGLLIPQLTAANRLAITPVTPDENGLLVFDITDNSFYYWKDTKWIKGLGNEIAAQLTYNAATRQLSIANGNTVDLSVLKEIPDQSSQTGKFLTTDGSQLSWATVSGLGDITGVSAGTGLSGGANTGDVSLSVNTDNTTISTNGLGQLQLSDVAVSTTKIKDGSVTVGKIAPGTNNTILETDASGQVKWIGAPADNQQLSLAGNTVTISNGNAINLNSLSTSGQVTGLLNSLSLSANSVTSSTIADGSIATIDLGDGTVTAPKIPNATITSAKLTPTGVTAGSYGDGTHVATFTTDAQGRVVLAGEALITGSAPTGTAGGDLTGNFPSPSIASTAGSNIIAAINTPSSTGTINTNRLASSVVLDSETPTGGDINGSFSGGMNIKANAVTTLAIKDSQVTDSKIANGITVSKLTPSTINGQYLTTSGGVTGWTTLPSSGTVLAVTAGTGLTGGTINTSGTISLSNTGVAANVYGDGTSVPKITVDLQGRIVAAAAIPITAAGGPASGDLTGTYPSPSIANNTINSAKIIDGAVSSTDILDGTISTVDIAPAAITAAKLASTSVSVGTYGTATQVAQFTVDQQGRITGATNVAITGAAPTGTAGGDLAGNFPNPTIASGAGPDIANSINNSAGAATISGNKINADFGSQTIRTTNAIAITGSGTLSVAGTSTLIGAASFNNGINVNGTTTLTSLGGGTNMVVAGPTGALSTQPIPAIATGNLTASTPGVSITGGSNAIVGTGVSLSIQNATASQQGLLTAADYTTFASKIGTTSSPASGDITGTFGSGLQVSNLLPSKLSQSGAATGDVMTWNGTSWAPRATVFDNITIYGSGTVPDPLRIKPGTANQVLTTNASNNVQWTNAAGLNTIITAAGDVTGNLNATTVGKIQGVAVSATAPVNDQVLRYDQSTSQWVPATVPATSSPVGFKVQQNNTQTFFTPFFPSMVTWDNEQYDDGGNFSANRFTAPSAGVYHFDATVSIDNMDKQQVSEIILRKGSVVTPVDLQRSYVNTGQSDGDITAVISTDVKLAAGDQVHVWVQMNVIRSTKGDGIRTQFSGRKIY